MKHILLLFLISILSLQCKKDQTPDPDPQIASIVGRWRLAGYEIEENGKKVWKLNPNDITSYITFRFDGVMLDSKGLAMCCPPSAYKLNGTIFKIIPKAELAVNPQCGVIDCVSCETLQMDQSGDELIITYCLIGK